MYIAKFCKTCGRELISSSGLKISKARKKLGLTLKKDRFNDKTGKERVVDILYCPKRISIWSIRDNHDFRMYEK